jgi:tRNA A37 threonylcarbamoyladenosine modification protein TsaB
VDVLVISIANPVLIGVYENKKLVKQFSQEGQSSDIIPQLFQTILKEFDIKKVLYVNAPGSYMAIKVAYMFLKTICIVKNIELLACSGFYFNQNSPIKALGKKYFILKDGTINIDFIDKNQRIEPFVLPKKLDVEIFSTATLPQYNLPAV